MKAALLAVAIASPTLAGDWPGWRGPNRDGVSTEKGLLQQWGPAGPPLAWKSSGVGSGFAGVAVAGERLYTMGDKDGAQHVFALKREGGAVLWTVRVGPPLVDSRGGARTTPVVDGERVYAIGTSGDLVCLEAATGKVVWSKNLERDYGGRMMSQLDVERVAPGGRRPPRLHPRGPGRRARGGGQGDRPRRVAGRRPRPRPEGPRRGRLLLDRDLERGRGEAVRPAPRPRPRRHPRLRREVPLGLQRRGERGGEHLDPPRPRQLGLRLDRLPDRLGAPRAPAERRRRRRPRALLPRREDAAEPPRRPRPRGEPRLRRPRPQQGLPDLRRLRHRQGAPGAATSATRAAARRR